MKAVAAALVLIAGAAVVLWYGNTLNSWVLGGLIGGLAALLLSIPISLTLFSYLSKRHDEQLQAEEREEYVQEHDDYPRVPVRVAQRQREVEGYVITDEVSEDAWQEREIYEPRLPRSLPAPTQQRQIPVNQGQGSRNSGRFSVPQQGTPMSTSRQQQMQSVQPRGKETKVLRATTKKIGTPAFSGYEPTSSLSQHRSDALRTARLEAVKKRQDDEADVSPTNHSKRALSVRPSHALAKQNEHETSIMPRRPSRQLPQKPANQPRQRRVIDSTPSQHGERHSLPIDGESTGTASRPEPRTDYSANRFSQTAPLRRSFQTDPIVRSLQGHEQQSRDEGTMEHINKPLVRRAPYMYDDDPLRQELAQHLDTPTVRRSSRFDEDDDDE